MIDKGFVGNDSALINNYFLTLIGIGLIIAIASPARFLFRQLDRRARGCGSEGQGFRTTRQARAGLFRSQPLGEIMSRLTADTTQIKAGRRLIAQSGGAQPDHADRGADHDVHHECAALGSRSARDPDQSFCRSSASAASFAVCRAKHRTPSAKPRAYAAENLAAYRTMQAYVNEKGVVRTLCTRRRADVQACGATADARARGV